MKELINARQIPGEGRRRWFYSDEFDLIVWLNEDGSFAGFELTYDKTTRERSIVWHPDEEFAHMAVDSGESQSGRPKSSPVLVPDSAFDAQRVYRAFLAESASLPSDIAALVLHALGSHPNYAIAL